MVEICSHTIAKNSEDFIIPCLKQILPYVNTALVSIDNNSTDRTLELVRELAEKELKIRILGYESNDPYKDLVRERNRQISMTEEEWIWIVDDDEYYLDSQLKQIIPRIGGYDAYSLKFWFLTDKEHYNHFRGRRTIRFYRNKPNLRWIGEFGNEHIPVKPVWHLNNSYLHLSYLKKYSWRNDFGQQYKYSQQELKEKLPINILEELWQKQELF